MTLDEYEKLPIKNGDIVEYAVFDVENPTTFKIGKVTGVQETKGKDTNYFITSLEEPKHSVVRNKKRVKRASPEHVI